MRVGAWRSALARESLPILICATFTALLAALVPQLLAADGWFALVSGRLIAEHGLPRHDTLAVLTRGREWIDQQWLGQLATYGLESLGGIRLLLAVNVVLVVSGFAAAAFYARRRGGEPATVAVVMLLALLPFLVTALNVRTQSFIYVALVILVATLARDRPMTARMTIAVLVLLVVWANVHGSALLAAALVALRGALDVRVGRRSGWLLLAGPWICLLASPYHVHLVSYYGRTAFNPTFSTYLGQWAPTSFSPLAAPVLILAFGAVWMMGRVGSSYSVYERWLLGAAVALALLAVRNWALATLLFIMFSPQGFDRALRRRSPRPVPAFGALVAALAVLGALASVVGALGSSNLTRNYPANAARAAAEAAANPGTQVYAGIAFADWLLWTHPELTGRVVFDVRYELLHASEVKRLALFDAGSRVSDPLGKPTAYVLDPDVEKDAWKGLRSDVRTVYNTDHAVVAVASHAR
jgi:hypothetical protein